MNETARKFIREFSSQYHNQMIGEKPDHEIDEDTLIAASILFQQIDKCTEFLEAIEHNEYEVRFVEFADADGYNPTIILMRVFIFPQIRNALSNHWYDLRFYRDTRPYGECTCSSSDENYNEEYGCCGESCGWNAPAMAVTKCFDNGIYEWIGDEKDYWGIKKVIQNEIGDEIGCVVQNELKQKLNDAKNNLQYWQRRVSEIEGSMK